MVRYFFVLSVAFFLLFPDIDPKVTALFWDGEKFYLEHNIFIEGLYYSVTFGAPLLFVGFLGTMVYQYIRKVEFNYLNKKNILYILLVGIIGSVLLVNAVLKDHWGRARPHSIVQFGGEKHYTPPFQPTQECEKNCSFVCGHASFGFLFVALWFLYRKKTLFIAAFTYGSFVGFARIVQGGHFLSDAIFSFFVMYATAWTLYQIMYKDKIGQTAQ